MANNKDKVKGEVENVRVVIRVRPLNKKEIADNSQHIVSVDRDEHVILLKKPGSSDKPKTFKFDHIFTDDCTQVR